MRQKTRQYSICPSKFILSVYHYFVTVFQAFSMLSFRVYKSKRSAEVLYPARLIHMFKYRQ